MQCDSWHWKRPATALGSRFSSFYVVSTAMLVLTAPAQAWSGALCVTITSTQLITRARGCVRTPRSSQSPYCSLCLPAPVWGTTVQEQHCNFSPAELLGPGRKFHQHKHSELSRRGSAQHAHTDITGCCAVSSLLSTGALRTSCPA